MRTIEITVYTYDELAEKAKECARVYCSQHALDDGWWEFIYEDAERIGLKITSFDTYRGTIKGRLTRSAVECCLAVRRDHGPDCDTRKTADRWIDILQGNNVGDTDNDKLAEDFEHDLLQDYLVMLREEEEYLTSAETIEENIRCNEYEFTKAG